ncbi:TetR family transcriptional regulator [Paenibacillus cellulosilyticus]|uniref:TetR family transcriptional regulator n=1 Tax=Paenibacillus cellulosilyticus TaxID=375489 RepID=A0A2V2Z2X5_9BACL|nr:TetR family transcriptional regulator [Paenibacillus cellulosilyticus]PWW08616.1 TetR family transcriptional regulator [Paenibacillus cellulosilyticus]QKS48184.1 TetR family transcriptional regulator [Paenibacillus cellulosilyticus]
MAEKVRNIRTTQTKQSLINAFIQLVSIKDFEKITIADITKGAQVNRATFYAHFNDKYELLGYMMGDSASTAILNRTQGEVKFDQASMQQLVLALCDFYQQPNIQCRSSYVSLVVPQLKDKAVNELKAYLTRSMEQILTADEKSMYVPIFAQMIHEGALQWATGQTVMSREEVAQRVAALIVGGFKVRNEYHTL